MYKVTSFLFYSRLKEDWLNEKMCLQEQQSTAKSYNLI